jgi:hypothetical protein
MKNTLTITWFQERFLVFLKRIKEVKPKDAVFVFVPGTTEFESQRNAKSIRFKGILRAGLLAADYIQLLNNALFLHLKQEILNETSNIFSFLDLVKVTSPLQQLSQDGVHFLDRWYQTFWKVFLSIFCAE